MRLIVMIEFKIKNGMKVSAKVNANSIEEAVTEIKNTHPECEILSTMARSAMFDKDKSRKPRW